MTDLIPLEPSVPLFKKYDVFITKVDNNNIIKEYSVYEEANTVIECIAHIKVECESEPLYYANNYKLVDGALVELTEEEKPLPTPPEPDKNTILEGRVNELQAENVQQSSDITTNSDMIFMTMDATTELNESNIQNTQMVLISMDALTEINEQLILLQEEVNKLKGGVA